MSFLFKCCSRNNSNPYQYQVDRLEGNTIKTEYVDDIKNISDWSNMARVMKVNKSQYEDLFKKYSQEGKQWTDPTFPPGPKSLGSIRNVPNDCQWKRISEIIPNPSLFVDKIEPQDVVQGSLGDCYFLSAVSALAEEPDRIRKVFGNQQYNRAGIYRVTLRIDGVIEQVLVDDYVPINASQKPLFCQPRNGQFWVLILEKAWAKANGSYANINSGTPSEVFKAVSYAPAELRPIKNTPESLTRLWEDILNSSRKNNPICCGTKKDEQVPWNQLGLSPGHAYTIIDAAILRTRDGSNHNLLKIRNPWGKNQWMGEANEGDMNFWEQVLPTERGPFTLEVGRIRNDGIFYMKYEDFYRYFNEIHFCHLLEKPMYEVENFKADTNQGNLFVVDVKKQDDYILEVHQSGIRGEHDQRKQQGLNRSTIIVNKHDSYEFIDGSLKYNEEDNGLMVHLGPGRYYVYTEIEPTFGLKLMPEKTSISSYSGELVNIEPVNSPKREELFNKMFLTYARQNRRKELNGGTMWISWRLLFEKGGFAYLAFGVDATSDKKFVLTLDEAHFEQLGYTLTSPHRGRGKMVLEVPPGKEEVIVARVKNQPLKAMKFPPEQLGIQMIAI